MSIRFAYKYAIIDQRGRVVETWYSCKEARAKGFKCKRILVEVLNPLSVAAMAG